jgi:hypothetical protein
VNGEIKTNTTRKTINPLDSNSHKKCINE